MSTQPRHRARAARDPRLPPSAAVVLLASTLALTLSATAAAFVASSATPVEPAPTASESAGDHIPALLPRDLPLADRVLALDEGQRAILDALLGDAEASSPDPESRMALRANIAAILLDGQRAKLDQFWDAIYRERMETAAAIGGEGVDLAAVARSLMRGDRHEALEVVISEYRRLLGPLLEARLQLVDGPNAGAADTAERLLRVRVEIREVNDRSLDRISAALPGGIAAEFRRLALEQGYPTVFVRSAVLEELSRLVDELPLDGLIELLREARVRFDAVCLEGREAVRLRDAIGAASAKAGERKLEADRRIAEAERAYDAFDEWLAAAIAERTSAEQLAATVSGRSIRSHLAAIREGVTHRWDDQGATLARFDVNRNGIIDADEASAVMKSFARSAGRQHGRRL